MNRKNLTAAVLAGLAGAAGIASSAQAVNLNPDGLGQVLIYPYFTSNDGNDTLMSVVNTTDSAKAVKVRFLEGYNSREVLDFNMYMSAFDVWVAAITDGGNIDPSQDGVPHLVIPDTTCTVPYLYGDSVADGLDFGLQEFLPFAYTGDFADGGPTAISRASEGYMELIEMGTLVDEDTETAKMPGSATAATHIVDEDGNQVPLDCYQLVDAWTEFGSGPDGYWIQDETLDIRRNSGGLFGGAAIINVGKGTMYGYNARAIQGFDKSSDGNHFRPGNQLPSLNSGNQNKATVFFGVPQDRAVELSYPRGVDAVSAVFMHEFLMNEYNVQADLNAASEWVVTFPTKAFYVDPTINSQREQQIWIPDESDDGCLGWEQGDDFPPRNGPDPSDGLGDDTDDDGIPEEQDVWNNCTYVQVGGALLTRPFTSEFDGEACENFNLEIWDREENASTSTTPDKPPIVSPAPPGGSTPPEAPFEMCYEVNVLRFGDVEVFGTDSDLLLEISNTPEAGWARVQFPRVSCTSGPDCVNGFEFGYHIDFEGLVGLPATGFWAQQFTNGFLGTPEASVLANYGALFDHKGSVRRMAPQRQSD